MALAMRMGTAEDRQGAAWIEAKIHALVEDAAELDVETDSAAAQLAALFGRLLACRKSFRVAQLDAPVHQAAEFPAVVDPVSGRRIGQLAGRNEIAATDFRRIDSDHVRCVLDQALHEIGGLGAAGTAVGSTLRR